MFEKTKAFFRWLAGGIAKSENPVQNSSGGKFRNEVPEVSSFAAFQIFETEKHIPDGFYVCTFEGVCLLDVADTIPVLNSVENAAFWCVRREDVPVAVAFPGKEPGKRIETVCTVRFEPDMGLGNLFKNRTSLEINEFSDMILSQMTGLLNIMRANPAELPDLDENAREIFRAKFSVLLSSQGMRCTNLEPFVEKENPLQEQVREVETELEEKVSKISDSDAWNAFVKVLTSEGMPASEVTESELKVLGDALIQNSITSQECVYGIRTLAQAAAGKKDLDASYWNGLAIRLRLDASAEKEGGNEDEDKEKNKNKDKEGGKAVPFLEFVPDVTPSRSRRPGKGWFFTRQVNLDKKLQNFLCEKVGAVHCGLIQVKSRVSDIRVQAAVRNLEKEISAVQDLLSVMPVLVSKTHDLRVENHRFPQILESMNQAVTAAEYLEAAVKNPLARTSVSFLDELKSTFTVLREQLQNRYNIH